jgi:hypothetical protein
MMMILVCGGSKKLIYREEKLGLLVREGVFDRVKLGLELNKRKTVGFEFLELTKFVKLILIKFPGLSFIEVSNNPREDFNKYKHVYPLPINEINFHYVQFTLRNHLKILPQPSELALENYSIDL